MAEGRVASLAEGALMAALAAVLVLSGYFIPPLQLLTNIVWTVPIVVLVVRQNLRLGLMATFIAGVVIALFTGPVNAVLLFAQFAALGLVYGYLFKIKAGAGRMITVGAVVSLLSLLLSLALTFKLTGMAAGGLIQQLEGTVNSAMDFYRRAGILDHLVGQGLTPEQIQASLQEMLNLLKLLLPGVLMTASLLAAFINYLVAERVLRRLGLLAAGLPPFRLWQLPWYAIWGVIAGLGLWQLGDYYHLDLASRLGVNILYVYIPLLAGNGLAAIIFILERFKVTPFLKVALVVAALINIPVTLISLVTLGVFDPFFNYRRRFLPPSGKGE
ncbi:YybS family protein [Moorella sp. Hama-1]|uniref:YybS family protein n=1 Tax=Moorella sp. Hama-1 TaxID=2138101 RepID=UPI000D643500|nr:YybS family protein [Moorella sp. Hama-1]MDN5361678.1 hypothetical protein [Moorella sp. (in: firmicutes)]